MERNIQCVQTKIQTRVPNKAEFFRSFHYGGKRRKKTTSPEGINPKDIRMRVDRYDRDQTLFHILTCDNRHDVLTEIKRNIGNGTHMNKKL